MTVTLSPAETIAASLCWLARMPGPLAGALVQRQVEGYWHDRTCRFCKIDRVKLMAQINDSWADPQFAKAVEAFDRLTRPAKTRAVKDAQERPWYDEVAGG